MYFHVVRFVGPEDYSPPHLDRVIPYLPKEDEGCNELVTCMEKYDPTKTQDQAFDPIIHAKNLRRILRTEERMKRRSQSTMRAMMRGGADPLSLMEYRMLFVSILRSAYEKQIQDGELDQHEFLAIALEASLDFAEDAASRDEPLSDWKYLCVFCAFPYLILTQENSVVSDHLLIAWDTVEGSFRQTAG